MIASLTGNVLTLGLDRVVIDAGGVGFLVLATPGTLAGLRVGQSASLLISMLVREDAITLYGFATEAEREAFDIVRAVNGIGAKTALAMLATLAPEDLYQAVREQNVKAIQRVPGVGAKIASRVLLELGGRLPQVATPPSSGNDADVRSQVIAALVGLGYPAKTAEQAANSAGEDAPDAKAPQLLRAALRVIAGGR